MSIGVVDLRGGKEDLRTSKDCGGYLCAAYCEDTSDGQGIRVSIGPTYICLGMRKNLI
jgi:hypothetical protein